MDKKQSQIIDNLNALIKERLEQKSLFKIKKINNLQVDKPFNFKTLREYTGTNRLLLDSGFYLTKLQALELGGKLKESAKAHKIVMSFNKVYLKIEYTNNNGEREEKIVLKKYFREKDYKDPIIKNTIYSTKYGYTEVFNIDDIIGLDLSKLNDFKSTANAFCNTNSSKNRNVLADLYINKYLKHEKIKIFTNEIASFYNKIDNCICIKDINSFENANLFYEQFFHECSHSTGHKTRLNRATLSDITATRGTAIYNAEEITAEMSAIYCLNAVNLLTYAQFDAAMSYINAYFTSDTFQKELEQNPKILLQVFSNAYRSFNFIFGGFIKQGGEENDQ